MKGINLIIIKYLLIKILLDLIRYNYRSLIRIKAKYYYLNKLRYYKTKISRLNFNSLLASIRYLKKLRKVPRNFWLRQHKIASFYSISIVKNAELSTKRRSSLYYIWKVGNGQIMTFKKILFE